MFHGSMCIFYIYIDYILPLTTLCHGNFKDNSFLGEKIKKERNFRNIIIIIGKVSKEKHFLDLQILYRYCAAFSDTEEWK